MESVILSSPVSGVHPYHLTFRPAALDRLDAKAVPIALPTAAPFGPAGPGSCEADVERSLASLWTITAVPAEQGPISSGRLVAEQHRRAMRLQPCEQASRLQGGVPGLEGLAVKHLVGCGSEGRVYLVGSLCASVLRPAA